MTSLTISKLTGKRATAETPDQFKVETVGVNVALAEDTGYKVLTIDTSCNGKISPLTPPEQRKEVNLFSLSSLTPYDTDSIIKRFADQHTPENAASPYANYYIQEPEEFCEGRAMKQSDSIRISTTLTANQSVTTSFPLEFSASSPNSNITNITVLANGSVIRNFPYSAPSVNDTKNVNLITLGNLKEVKLEIIALDANGFSNSISLPLKIVSEDTDKPVLTTSSIKVTANQSG